MFILNPGTGVFGEGYICVCVCVCAVYCVMRPVECNEISSSHPHLSSTPLLLHQHPFPSTLPFPRSTRTLYAVTVVQKVITFIFNNLIVRQTNPQIFGVAAVQLELLLSTMLFLSREGRGRQVNAVLARYQVLHGARRIQHVLTP
jgi:hypothetical protein